MKWQLTEMKKRSAKCHNIICSKVKGQSLHVKLYLSIYILYIYIFVYVYILYMVCVEYDLVYYASHFKLHFKSLMSPSPWNEFILASMSLCSVCNISSHGYANHEAYRTTIALVNICTRCNNPLLPHLLLNAKCPNRSERQQRKETFQQHCLWGKHFCVE